MRSVALVVGAVGVVMYPRPHYLWLPSIILVIASISLLAWLAVRVLARDRQPKDCGPASVRSAPGATSLA